MNAPVTVTWNVRFEHAKRGRRRLQKGPSPNAPRSPQGRVPRISRLMALEIKMDGLVRTGAVRDYAELARVGMVSRARVTQIMILNLLAPDIQEELLFLPRTVRGRDAVVLRDMRAIVSEANWKRQIQAWKSLQARVKSVTSRNVTTHHTRCF
jgi:hypothetical protein